MTDWNGFDKGVIGKKLPSDKTLNNMRKADLIELLHIAEHNHKVLANSYRIAVDNSKCNSCPLGQADKKIRKEVLREVSESMYHQCFECENDENMQKWDGGNWFRYKLFENVMDKLKEGVNG